MSDEKIQGRPLPFEIKTAIMQLVAMAIATPEDVADIGVNVSPHGPSIDVLCYVGGYDGKRNGGNADITQSIYFHAGNNVADAVKQLNELIAKINTATANGRQIKAQRLRDEAAALIKRATELETASELEKATVCETTATT